MAVAEGGCVGVVTGQGHSAKRAFVTGGAGFIGSTLVDRLLALGWSVSAFDSSEDRMAAATCRSLRARE